MAIDNPEIGKSLRHGPFTTNYHDVGVGDVVLLLHGSGPGVSAFANWRLVIPELARTHRVIAPDIVGFGYTEFADRSVPDMSTWVEFVRGFLAALGVSNATIIGNSFGGALGLRFASNYPAYVDRLVLMGSVGVHFDLTDGLDDVWGYEPSLVSMRHLLDVFVYDPTLLPPDLAERRYAASVREGAQERWASLFPAPRQRWIDALALSHDELAAITAPTLVVHGREDAVIPMRCSVELAEAIPDAHLHVFPHTGHWVQIERVSGFLQQVRLFLSEG